MANMLTAFKKYAVFEGRARRSEYWLFVLFQILVSIGLGVVGGVLDSVMGTGPGQSGMPYGMVSLTLACISGLVFLIPSIAVAVRRLHDTDKSGWFLLLGLIPLLGALILLIFYCLDGTPGPNKFGPDPKGRG